ncbi:MAG: DNA mismatch repair protein MutS [Oscillospiraceae bacterium]|nr:DNA mismatch repair protein MutS [Oscillospiraceae bacterium]
MAELSPMMQQYFRIKEKHKEHILFFRLGDFYEMFFDDAHLGSKELGLTLTGRDCGLKERAPMCGVPHHSCENYIAKLVRRGYKVAICEQTEDPAFAKGVVSREVVRVITPGTVLENNLLTEDSNNFLCCIFLDEKGCGLVFADISTGEMNLIESETVDDSAIMSELARYSPREVVFNTAFLDKKEIAKYMREKLSCTADLLSDETFSDEASTPAVLNHFGKASLEDIGLNGRERCAKALGAMLLYLLETQKQGIERLVTLNIQEESRYMELDSSARMNLELLHTLRTKERRGSLLWVLDKTKTPMGKRLIKSWILRPLTSPAEIEKRLNAVEELYKNEVKLKTLTEELGGIFDIERLLTRIVYGNANPREYKTLAQAITRLPGIKSALENVKSNNLTKIYGGIDLLEDVETLISLAVMDEPPVTLKDGGVIAKGYDQELDGLRSLVSNAQGYLAELEVKEREKTGIKNLKIGYNKVFGYYLEVTKSYLELVPEAYIRKQTLAGCERYIIQELKELEEKILTARDKSIAIEQKLFEDMRGKVISQLHRIQRTATAIAKLDVLSSFAGVSLENRYIRPIIGTNDVIEIKDGRHPVIEQVLEDAPFVPNDTLLDRGENQISIVTGPNMAGKSTFMRQTALIVLIAQIGCFVPAAAAKIGIVDGIYTRIGASDDIVTGQSTFMVEMCEVAQILKSATEKSLLILDEIGRGTSTYDGMSIARAVIEYAADKKKLGAKTLFATHYHELTEMEDSFSCVKNYNTAVKKRGDDITFLHKIIRGGADDSYGIEVSKLAGIPQWIIERAFEVLTDLESARPVREKKRGNKHDNRENKTDQVILLGAPSKVDEALKALDLNTLTPIEALTFLYKLKEMAGG